MIVGGLPEADVLLLLVSVEIVSDLRLVPVADLEPSLSENLGIFVNANGFLVAAATAEVLLADVGVGAADFVTCLGDEDLPIYTVSSVTTFVRA